MLTISSSSKTILTSTLLLLASTLPVIASKLTAPPLPHAKDMTDSSQVQQIAPSNSRFHKSNDFRDVDKANQEQTAKSEKQAEIEQQKLNSAQVKAEQARIKGSIDANNMAVQLGRQGRFIEAIQQHETAVQLDPNNKQFRINLSAARTAYGQQRLAQGDFASASHLFRQALSSAAENGLAGRLLVTAISKSGLNPSSPDVRISIGDQLIKAGDLEGATIEYQAALELADSAKAYTKMGDMALRYGQVGTAVSWYKQAMAKDPDYAIAYRQLGFISLAQKDSTQAAAYLRKAVILDGKDTLAGDALVDLWRKQVASSPNIADNHLGLAAALQITGDLNGALDEYQKVQSIDPKNPHLASAKISLNSAYQRLQSEKHKLAAQTFYSQNLRKEALAEISQAVMIEPRNAKYQQLLGECLEANGDYQGAHQAYLTCVLIDPENNKEAAARMKQMQSSMTASSTSLPPVNKNQEPATSSTQSAGDGLSHENQPNIASAQTFSKDMFEGRRDANLQTSGKNAEQINSAPAQTEPNKNGTVNDLQSKISQAESQKDYEGAADILKQILATDLKNADLHHRLAVNLMNSGNIVEAISEFRIASALKPGAKEYSEDLAQALTIHKRAQVADSSVVTGVKQDPPKQGSTAEGANR